MNPDPGPAFVQFNKQQEEVDMELEMRGGDHDLQHGSEYPDPVEAHFSMMRWGFSTDGGHSATTSTTTPAAADAAIGHSQQTQHNTTTDPRSRRVQKKGQAIVPPNPHLPHWRK